MYFTTIICFNSEYTKRNTESTFKLMKRWKGRRYVVYPCMHEPSAKHQPEAHPLLKPKNFILSLNRFETRKNLSLALEMFKQVVDRKNKQGWETKLVLAGGLDTRNSDAIECLKELKLISLRHGISERVVFMANITEEQKEYLLK